MEKTVSQGMSRLINLDYKSIKMKYFTIKPKIKVKIVKNIKPANLIAL